MKRFFGALLLCLLTGGLYGEIRFAGFFKEDGACLFSLSEAESDKGGWYKIGDTFNGLVITEFDHDGERLALAGPAGTIYIGLVSSRIGPGRKWDGSRSGELAALIEEMTVPAKQRSFKVHSTEDYIALGTSYGLVVKRLTRGGLEIIEMEAPDLEARRAGKGEVRTRRFSLQSPPRKDMSARKVIIVF